MALIRSDYSFRGVLIGNAYAVISLTSLQYKPASSQSARIDVHIKPSQTSEIVLESLIYTFEKEYGEGVSKPTFNQMFGDVLQGDGVDPRSVVYDYLKTLPEWTGWEDDE